MTVARPGDQLHALLRGAIAEAVLIAPFIKVDALRTALAVLPPDGRLKVVTRWRPEEIQAGVSDLQVFDELALRHDAELRLCDRLHAKYYRADRQVLLGSANLTGLGMGWRSGANIELLRATSFDDDLAAFEGLVESQSVRATAEIRGAIAAAVAALPEAELVGTPGHPDFLSVASFTTEHPWLPQSRYPSNLWLMYSGQPDRLTRAAREDAAADLVGLSLPPGLHEGAFGRYVAAVLAQQLLIQEVDAFARKGLRFGAMRRALRCHTEVIAAGRAPEELLQTLMRWLVHFGPDKYEVRVSRFSESLRRRKSTADLPDDEGD